MFGFGHEAVVLAERTEKSLLRAQACDLDAGDVDGRQSFLPFNTRPARERVRQRSGELIIVCLPAFDVAEKRVAG